MGEIIDRMVKDTEGHIQKDTRQRYKGVCPVCGKENWICKSLAMEMGINVGTGSCLGCGTFMHITFNPKRQEMDLERFEDYTGSERARQDTNRIAGNVGYGGQDNELYNEGWIDLKSIFGRIDMRNAQCKIEYYEKYARDTLQKEFPALYRYIYKDFHGNIRINKNAFKHADEVVRYLPFILELNENTEYTIYFGNTLAETFSFTRRDYPLMEYEITIRPFISSEHINITFTFEEGNIHDEQKPD